MNVEFIFFDDIIEEEIISSETPIEEILLLKGETGSPGADGADGVSPTLTETATTEGYDITIKDINGTRTISLLNGEKGDTGEQRKSRNTREWNSKYNQNWYKWIDRYLHHNIYKWRY